MAIMAGITVANLYYNQPLLNLMAATFHQPHPVLGRVTMLTQIGYAIGLLVFVPLGDYIERRRLVERLLLAAAAALVLVAISPSLWWCEIASFLAGMLSAVPQIIIPMAADLADNQHRGRVVGIIMSGLLVGVLLARTISGFVGGFGGWRLMFWIAAVLMIIMLAFSRMLPLAKPIRKAEPFTQVLGSLIPLMKKEPELVRVALTGFTFFAAFSAYWTTLTFRLAASPYHYGASTIGLFGLAGVAGALAAPVAGRRADRADPRQVVTVLIFLDFLVFLVMGLFNQHLIAILITIVLLDLATNGAQISNQSRIYALHPEARSRSNTVYMVFYFVGGALGSGLGSIAYHLGQMPWTMALSAIFLLVGLLVHLWSLSRYARPQAPESVK